MLRNEKTVIGKYEVFTSTCFPMQFLNALQLKEDGMMSGDNLLVPDCRHKGSDVPSLGGLRKDETSGFFPVPVLSECPSVF